MVHSRWTNDGPNQTVKAQFTIPELQDDELIECLDGAWSNAIQKKKLDAKDFASKYSDLWKYVESLDAWWDTIKLQQALDQPKPNKRKRKWVPISLAT